MSRRHQGAAMLLALGAVAAPAAVADDIPATVRAEPVEILPPSPRPLARLRDAALAATCAQCHGPDGRPPAGSSLPALAGQPAAALAEAMQAYVDGRRPGTVMPQLARGYDAAQIARLAAWFSAQPRPRSGPSGRSSLPPAPTAAPR